MVGTWLPRRAADRPPEEDGEYENTIFTSSAQRAEARISSRSSRLAGFADFLFADQLVADQSNAWGRSGSYVGYGPMWARCR